MTYRAGHGRWPVNPVAWLLIQPIRFYQRFITPYTPATCRYYPTCSEYAVQSLRTHGAVKGLILTAWRLLRCNPWSQGGIDPTPGRGRWRSARTLTTSESGAADAAGDAVAGTVPDAHGGGPTAEDAVILGAATTISDGGARTHADVNPCVAGDAPNAGRAAA